MIRSGSGGAGIDHWHATFANPCCKVTLEDLGFGQATRFGVGYALGHTAYITCKESWDALLDLEKMGLEFRDVDDEFAGAEFRDDETKIMFAYDYDGRHVIRLRGGAHIKPIMYNELKWLGVGLYERIIVTSLLTKGGKP